MIDREMLRQKMLIDSIKVALKLDHVRFSAFIIYLMLIIFNIKT